ncbi:MAG: CGGC domain-containing protein [bacterium]
MKKAMLIGCGHYMGTGYGCPGEWRCLKAAALGEGKFDEPVSVISFVKCECPGRPLLSNIGMAIKLSEIKPDVIHLTSCMATAKPGCPHLDMEEISRMITEKFSVPVIMGTHEYK